MKASISRTASLCAPLKADADDGCSFWRRADRKSTRLNSSHLVISYAVFCLKKKTNDSCPRGPSHERPQSVPQTKAFPCLRTLRLLLADRPLRVDTHGPPSWRRCLFCTRSRL